MEVTVYDPVRGEVSSEQVDAYIMRTGREGLVRVPLIPRGWHGDEQALIESIIKLLSSVERRQPSAVLADIACEVPG